MIEQVVVDTLESAPSDATHWSTRGLAAKQGISHATVGGIWRAFGLKPWLQDSFKVSPDPDLVDKIRDIVGLYMNPTTMSDSGIGAVQGERPNDPLAAAEHAEAAGMIVAAQIAARYADAEVGPEL